MSDSPVPQDGGNADAQPDAAESIAESATESITPGMPMDEAMMAEMMDLLIESQQVYLGAPTAAKDDAEQATLQDWMHTAPATALRENAEPLDLTALLQSGGETALALMQYSVRSMNFDLLFAALVREYQLRPMPQAVLAIYESFCAPAAPARLSLPAALATHDTHLRPQVEVMRLQLAQMQTPPEDGDAAPPRMTTPHRSMFDALLRSLQNSDESAYAHATRWYDPARSVPQNLPGGDMTMPQRHFLTRVWLPRLRPRLVAAGFWHLSTVE